MSKEQIASAKPGQYLTFVLQGQTFGVPIETVREINRVTEIAPVPKTHPCVAGVMNLRGKVIPVIDLRLMLGMPSAAHTKETCVVVIESKEGQIGATVDAVAPTTHRPKTLLLANLVDERTGASALML